MKRRLSGLYIDSITIENEGERSEQDYADVELGSPPKKKKSDLK